MYYSVYRGCNPDIYNTWDECKINVIGFKGALYKKFEDYADAQEYLLNGPQNLVNKTTDVGSIEQAEQPDLSEFTAVWTDGSLLRRSGTIACGYGIYIPKLDISHSIKLIEPKTNNRAELKAIIDAVMIMKQHHIDKILVYTDSSYSILIFGSTGKKYKKKKYKNVKNKDLVEKAVTLAEETTLHFIHVSAHSGDESEIAKGNDVADRLANQAAVKDYLVLDSNWIEREYNLGKYKKCKLTNIPKEYLENFIVSDSIENRCKKNENIRTIKHIVEHYLKQH